MNSGNDYIGITETLAEFCDDLRYDHLTDELVDRVKYRFLDFVGVAAPRIQGGFLREHI